MTLSPPSASSSIGARSPEEAFRIVRRRNRVPLSCYPCRTRKLKCDRNHPCANCVKREGSDASSCSYASPARKKAHQPGQAATSPDDMQNRIDRLESLVLSLMHGGATTTNTNSTSTSSVSPAVGGHSSQSQNNASSSSPNTATTGTPDNNSQLLLQDTPENDNDDDTDTDDGLASSLGVLKVDYDRGKSMYVGQQHWHTILTDIAEVKNYFVCHKKDLERSYEKVLSSKPATARDGPTFLLGTISTSDVELRAELPPKSSVLTLCGRYFNSMDNAVNIIHAPTFHKQLQAHWQDPSKTPIMWLGLLYSILCLAMLSYHKVGDEPAEWRGRTFELAAEYRLRTVQCLVTADYTKPTEYTVETMILYMFGEHSTLWDAEFGLWLISSLIVRIAFRMGYHRDAKWFPSITPFQAEMRRRTWAMVRMCDVMFSHLVSLPSMISENDCDAQLPSNIFDEEFGVESKVLPPPRPASEATPISYMIAKTGMCIELGNILQATGRIGKQVPYEDILQFDARLVDLKTQLPLHLRIQPLDGSQDPVTLIIARFNLDILYQKIICILHRKYLPRARVSTRYSASRRRAIEASLETLRHLCTLYQESQPNGRLRSLRWHVNSIATKDFLLPAMIIAVDLNFDTQARRSGHHAPETTFFWTDSQLAEMISLLETTRDIWRGLADESIEAVKAFNILNIMLEKIKAPAPTTAAGAAPQPAISRNAQMTDYRADEMQPEQSAAMTLGMLSSGVAPIGSSFGSPPDVFAGNEHGVLGGPLSGPGFGNEPGSEGLMAGFDSGSFAGPGGGMSPMTMFSNLANPMDLSVNFDWDTVASYAQSANWGSDQNFQFFTGSAEQQGQGVNAGGQFMPDSTSPEQ